MYFTVQYVSLYETRFFKAISKVDEESGQARLLEAQGLSQSHIENPEDLREILRNLLFSEAAEIPEVSPSYIDEILRISLYCAREIF